MQRIGTDMLGDCVREKDWPPRHLGNFEGLCAPHRICSKYVLINFHYAITAWKAQDSGAGFVERVE